MSMNHHKYFLWLGVIFFSFLAVLLVLKLKDTNIEKEPEGVFCTMDAKICSDGTSLGRQGPKCEFAKCPYDNKIVVSEPIATSPIESPVKIKGKALGNWFFEGSFPITLKDPKGNVIGQAVAQAQADWMTTGFVPFEAILTFSEPEIDLEVGGMGSLIFQKDNPSDLSENDDHLIMPIGFVTY